MEARLGEAASLGTGMYVWRHSLLFGSSSRNPSGFSSQSCGHPPTVNSLLALLERRLPKPTQGSGRIQSSKWEEEAALQTTFPECSAETCPRLDPVYQSGFSWVSNQIDLSWSKTDKEFCLSIWNTLLALAIFLTYRDTITERESPCGSYYIEHPLSPTDSTSRKFNQLFSLVCKTFLLLIGTLVPN